MGRYRPSLPQEPHQKDRQSITSSLMGVEGAVFGAAQRPAPQHNIGAAFRDRRKQPFGFRGHIAAVAIHEDHRFDARGKRGQGAHTGITISATRLHEHAGPVGPRDLRCAVRRAVVHYKDPLEQRRRRLVQNRPDRGLFVERGDNQRRSHIHPLSDSTISVA